MKTSHFISAVQMAKSPRTTWSMVKAIFRGQYKPSFKTSAYFFLLLAYIIFPLDILPDFIPFIGWVDDGILLTLFISRLNTEAQLYSRKAGREPEIQIIK